MIQKLRETLALVLIAALPFHAFFVTVVTKILTGPGHAPLAQFALWKESLLLLILLVSVLEILKKKRWWKLDVIDIMILLLVVLSVIVTALTHKNWGLYLFGFRYDFIPLIAFGVLRRVEWSEKWLLKAKNTLLIVGSIIAGYGIISFFLPAEFFHWLGYSDLHSLYIPNGPLAPFQLIGETGLRRIQSTMSGPNQLGLWLLIPVAVGICHITTKGEDQRYKKQKTYLYLASSILSLVAIVLTFSRAAWIGAFVLFAITLSPVIARMPRKLLVILSAFIVVAGVAAVAAFPSVILRLSSTKGHIEGPIQAVQTMISHPFGRGLGTAGPASNRVSDTCVLLNEGDDPAWAQVHSNLCVFVGDAQVQPVDRTCSCPFLPENWYLQIGVEMGWVGFALYLALVGVVIYRLRKLIMNNEKLLTIHYSLFISLGVAALFLHAFEDAAVAYTLWIAIAALLPVAHRTKNS